MKHIRPEEQFITSESQETHVRFFKTSTNIHTELFTCLCPFGCIAPRPSCYRPCSGVPLSHLSLPAVPLSPSFVPSRRGSRVPLTALDPIFQLAMDCQLLVTPTEVCT